MDAAALARSMNLPAAHAPCRVLCYNSHSAEWRYRLGVRTEDSQSSNPGSIPGSATKTLLLSRVIS
jgi:hypothetical protein